MKKSMFNFLYLLIDIFTTHYSDSIHNSTIVIVIFSLSLNSSIDIEFEHKIPSNFHNDRILKVCYNGVSLFSQWKVHHLVCNSTTDKIPIK